MPYLCWFQTKYANTNFSCPELMLGPVGCCVLGLVLPCVVSFINRKDLSKIRFAYVDKFSHWLWMKLRLFRWILILCSWESWALNSTQPIVVHSTYLTDGTKQAKLPPRNVPGHLIKFQKQFSQVSDNSNNYEYFKPFVKCLKMSQVF